MITPHPDCPIAYDFEPLVAQTKAFLAANPQYDKTLDTPAYAVLDRALQLCLNAKGLPPFREANAEVTSAQAMPQLNAAMVGGIVWFLAEYCAKEGINMAEAINQQAHHRRSE